MAKPVTFVALSGSERRQIVDKIVKTGFLNGTVHKDDVLEIDITIKEEVPVCQDPQSTEN